MDYLKAALSILIGTSASKEVPKIPSRPNTPRPEYIKPNYLELPEDTSPSSPRISNGKLPRTFSFDFDRTRISGEKKLFEIPQETYTSDNEE